MTKHPHHEVITAYLEGKEIELQNREGEWELIPPFSELNAIPAFWKERVYRVKPTKILEQYLMKFDRDDYRNPKLRKPEHWETADVVVQITDGKVTKMELL